MDKQEVIKELKRLAAKLNTSTLRQRDVRTVSKLEFYAYIHFKNLAEALLAAGLQPSPLAQKMNTTDDALLVYLYKLGEKKGKRPTWLDLKREKKYTTIFRTRFRDASGKPILLKRIYEKAVKKFAETISIAEILIPQEKNIVDFPEKRRFFGEAAQYLVIAELLYRGFNASRISVDSGLDVQATKESRTYNVQVKNIDFTKTSIRTVRITTSSFDKNRRSDVFYIFVLWVTHKERLFLILNYQKMRDLEKKGYLQKDKSEEKKIAFIIGMKGQNVYAYSPDRSKHEDLSGSLDDWDVIV